MWSRSLGPWDSSEGGLMPEGGRVKVYQSRGTREGNPPPQGQEKYLLSLEEFTKVILEDGQNSFGLRSNQSLSEQERIVRRKNHVVHGKLKQTVGRVSS